MTALSTRLALAAFLLAAPLAACSDDDTATETGDTSSTTASAADGTSDDTAADSTEAGITVEDVWCRTSPMNAENGACYMLITNGGSEDDALTGAMVATTIAGETQIHETTTESSEGMDSEGMDSETDTTAAGGMESGGMSEGEGAQGEMTTTTAMGETEPESMTGSEGDMGGPMVMREVDEIPVPAGETVELKPGGYHVMLLELVAPLEEGSEVELTLTFEKAGEQTVTAEVRAS